MEHNYNNLHLSGSYSEQQEMVHNQREIKYFNLGNIIGGFISILIGVSVASTMLNTSVQSLKENGLL